LTAVAVQGCTGATSPLDVLCSLPPPSPREASVCFDNRIASLAMSCSDNSSAVPCMDGNIGNDGQLGAPSSVPWSRLQELVRLLLLTDKSPAQQPFEEEEADAPVLPWYVVCRTSVGSADVGAGEQSNAFCSPVDTLMLVAFGNMGWSSVVVVALLLSSPMTASPSPALLGGTTIRDIMTGDAKKITIRRPCNW
jgi:hypothetical protein